MGLAEKKQAVLGLCPVPEREVQTRSPSTNINSPPPADSELYVPLGLAGQVACHKLIFITICFCSVFVIVFCSLK